MYLIITQSEILLARESDNSNLLGVQLCFRRFPIDGFSGKWWSK